MSDQNPTAAIDQAKALVHAGGDRHEDYGHPLDDFTVVTEAMNAFGFRRLNRDGTVRRLTAEDHPVTMIFVKLAREWEKPKQDNRVDLIGYGETLDMIHNERARRACEGRESKSSGHPQGSGCACTSARDRRAPPGDG